MLAPRVAVVEGEVVEGPRVVLDGDPALALGMVRPADLPVEHMLVEAGEVKVVEVVKMVDLDMVLGPVLVMARLVAMALMVERTLKEVAKVEAVGVDKMVVPDLVPVPVLAMVKLGDMVLTMVLMVVVVHMLKVEAKVEVVAVDKMVDLVRARGLVLDMVKLVDMGPTMADIGLTVVDMLRQVVKVVVAVVGKAFQAVVVLGVAQEAVLDPPVCATHRTFIGTNAHNAYKNATENANVLCV